MDLATYDGVEQLYARITSGGRPVDAIAINAGVGVGGDFRPDGLEGRTEPDQSERRLHGASRQARLAGHDGARQRANLFTSSIAALMPAPFEAVYGASKAFVLSFSEALRNELKDTGVSVTALMPGPTETNFFHRADMDDTTVGVSKKDDPDEVAKQGFEALMAGKDKIIAGSLKTKIQGHASQVLPSQVSAEQHRKMSEPGSGSK